MDFIHQRRAVRRVVRTVQRIRVQAVLPAIVLQQKCGVITNALTSVKKTHSKRGKKGTAAER